MSNPLVDFSSKQGLQLVHKLAVKHKFPDYVQDASPNDFAANAFPSKCAQLTPEPRLPCHSKCSTWLSYAAFVEQRDEITPSERQKIADYLEDRVRFFGIEDEIAAIEAREMDLIKEALETDERFPVRNEAEAKAAADWLVHQVSCGNPQLDLDQRVELVSKIGDFMPVTGTLAKVGCRSGCYDGAKVAALIREAVKPDSVGSTLADMCERLRGAEMQAHHKMAAAVCEAIGILGPCPELSLAVNTLDPVVHLQNGVTVRKEAVDALDSHGMNAALAFHRSLGPSPDRRSKAAAAADSSLADEICRDLKEAGVRFEVEQPFQELRVTSL